MTPRYRRYSSCANLVHSSVQRGLNSKLDENKKVALPFAGLNVVGIHRHKFAYVV
jgi:hypothetical protein